MQVEDVQISAGFTGRMRPRTDDAIVNIHKGEISIELECILEENKDIQEMVKFTDLVIKINKLIEEHNKSL